MQQGLDQLDQSDISFWKHLILAILFFALTPVAIGISLFTLFTMDNQRTNTQMVASAQTTYYPKVQAVSVFSSLPDVQPGVSGTSRAQDARVEIIRQYLEQYQSPLAPWAQVLVQKSQDYGLDFRLLTAIAQQESNLCKKIPEGTYNCWGWGIHSQGTLGFESFEQAIEIVSRGLKTDYVDLGYATPEQIMSKYTPHSPEGAWAKGVSQFLDEMR